MVVSYVEVYHLLKYIIRPSSFEARAQPARSRRTIKLSSGGAPVSDGSQKRIMARRLLQRLVRRLGYICRRPN